MLDLYNDFIYNMLYNNDALSIDEYDVKFMNIYLKNGCSLTFENPRDCLPDEIKEIIKNFILSKVEKTKVLSNNRYIF